MRKPHRLNLINRAELSGKSKEIEFRVAQQTGTIDDVQHLLMSQNYICGRALATVVFLALRLGRPLFLEGEAGIGKTEIAKAIAAASGFLVSFGFSYTTPTGAQ